MRVDRIFPEVGVSTVRVLRRLGVEVAYPEGQTCCGQPAFNSGLFREARTVARHFLDVFEGEPAYLMHRGGGLMRTGHDTRVLHLAQVLVPENGSG